MERMGVSAYGKSEGVRVSLGGGGRLISVGAVGISADVVYETTGLRYATTTTDYLCMVFFLA